MEITKMTEQEIAEEIKVLKETIGEATVLGKNLKKKFEEMGYEYAILGTGANSIIRSKEIKVMELNNKKYLKGKFIVVGIYSIADKNGRSVFYRGYVKQIG